MLLKRGYGCGGAQTEEENSSAESEYGGCVVAEGTAPENCRVDTTAGEGVEEEIINAVADDDWDSKGGSAEDETAGTEEAAADVEAIVDCYAEGMIEQRERKNRVFSRLLIPCEIIWEKVLQ
ncbi:unnamed protein product [Cuscuta europaea]|uniref:Uncharacterized protein n=1 Tax=Cuscuta europaea TaxID=41803 RepID=A0A9P0ZL05_CUSEU|nr:unnamed protein product [Cuscuta europaea]